MGQGHRLRLTLRQQGHGLDRRAKADIRTDGTTMAKAPRMAFCWVALIGEIIRPMPTTDRMNRMRLTSSSPNEPLNGIWNGPAAAAIINSPSMVPMTSAGRDLDMMISGVEVGDTSN